MPETIAFGRSATLVDVNNPLPTTEDAAQYFTVAASQTAQVLGATGAIGDKLSIVTIIPATTSPGAVTLLDGATSITLFTGGATSVQGLAPLNIFLYAKSKTGAWKITTGANVSVIATGTFT